MLLWQVVQATKSYCFKTINWLTENTFNKRRSLKVHYAQNIWNFVNLEIMKNYAVYPRLPPTETIFLF